MMCAVCVECVVCSVCGVFVIGEHVHIIESNHTTLLECQMVS